MQSDDRCKGFWRMCRCKHCRDADRELEKRLDNAGSREERNRIISEGVKDLKAARNIQ